MQNSKFKIQKLMWLILGVVVILLAGFIFIRWWNRGVVEIKAFEVERGLIEAVVTASGIVDAPVYELAPKMGGKLIAIKVKEGATVWPGQTLAEFDDTTRLVAPASGIVAKINYDRGETVSPGVPALVVVNYDKSWVEAQIDEIDIAAVEISDRAKITTDVYPDRVYEGEIFWIAPLAELRRVGGRVKMDEESYVFPCKINFLGAHDELKVNMSVNVDITTQKKEAALIVPREALVAQNDETYVFMVKKGRVFEQKINLGIRSFASVEVTAGLEEGAFVAISNGAKLKDKGRVKIGK